MKATFKSEDPQEIRRLAKADDMAIFIWELVHNGWRDMPKGYHYGPAWDKIHKLLIDHSIVIDDLTG